MFRRRPAPIPPREVSLASVLVRVGWRASAASTSPACDPPAQGEQWLARTSSVSVRRPPQCLQLHRQNAQHRWIAAGPRSPWACASRSPARWRARSARFRTTTWPQMSTSRVRKRSSRSGTRSVRSPSASCRRWRSSRPPRSPSAPFPSSMASGSTTSSARATAVHLGVAISLRGGGLVAPAIHDADERRSRRAHGGAARSRRPRPRRVAPRVRDVGPDDHGDQPRRARGAGCRTGSSTRRRSRSSGSARSPSDRGPSTAWSALTRSSP